MSATGANSQAHAVQHQQHHTPPASFSASSVSPSSSSPASPRQTGPQSHKGGQYPYQRPVQISQPKTTTFVPAVLRPTERPLRPSVRSRCSPLTPPRSLHSSTDSLSTTATADTAVPTVTPAPSAPSARPDPTRVSRPAILLARPSGAGAPSSSPPSPRPRSGTLPGQQGVPQPTRMHWKPDALAPECDSPACPAQFGLLTRRHHCRRCGGVFCSRHADREVPLSADAAFCAEGEGGWWRACEACWREWIEAVVMADDGDDDGDANGGMRGGGGGMGIKGKTGEQGKRGSVAGSVPRDWNWSTF